MSKQMQRKAKEEMYPIIEDWQSSGLTKKAYCEQKFIAPSLFFYWQKKYKEDHEAGGFLPINLGHENKTPDMGFIEVKYPNGVAVRLSENTGIEMIKRFVYL